MKSADNMTTFGTYGATGLKTRPDVTNFENGVVAGQDLPEAWWNYLWNLTSANSDVAKADIANLIAELTTVLASSGLSPDNVTTTQIDAALKAKYVSRLGTVVTDFNSISTSGLPLGSVTAFYTSTGYTNGPSGATVQTGLILRSNVAADSAIVLAFGNASTMTGSYPMSFRIRTAGTWLAWTNVVGSNNMATTATANTGIMRDGSGRAKVVAPSAEDDVALKSTVTAEATLARNADNLTSGTVPFARVPPLLTLKATDMTDDNPSILIPLYIYPTGGGVEASYASVIATARKYPRARIYAIVNPASGPGTVVDGNFTDAIIKLRAAGVTVLGYISTDYPTVPGHDAVTVAAAKGKVDTWRTLYPLVDGLFLDEMTYNDPLSASVKAYYEDLTSYAHNLGYFPVIANPGVAVPVSYPQSAIADVIVIHETSSWPTESALRDWGYNTDAERQKRAVLVYGSGVWDIASFLMCTKYVGMIFCNSAPTAVLPNPWAVLTAQLDDQVYLSQGELPDTIMAKLNLSSGTVALDRIPTPLTGKSANALDVYSWAKAATKPSYTKSEVGLGNVDNTADASKSVSYANSAGSAGSAPASDVYAWAKASVKPSYSATEIIGLFKVTSEDVALVSGNNTMSAMSVGELRFFTGKNDNVVSAVLAPAGGMYTVYLRAYVANGNSPPFKVAPSTYGTFGYTSRIGLTISGSAEITPSTASFGCHWIIIKRVS